MAHPRNFIEHESLPNEGWCKYCDFQYSLLIPAQVQAHAVYHSKYRRARRQGWAPLPRERREDLLHEGLRLQREGATLHDRVEGGRRWLIAKYHNHLERVLLWDHPRQTFSDFFAAMEKGGLRGRFDDDVAAALRYRYSNQPWFGDVPPGARAEQ